MATGCRRVGAATVWLALMVGGCTQVLLELPDGPTEGPRGRCALATGGATSADGMAGTGETTGMPWCAGALISQGPPEPVGECLDEGVVVDLNGDGAPDVALLTDLGWSLSVLFNRGDGTFASAVTWPLDGTWWWNSLVAADLDGDGALDLAAVDYNSGLVGVLLNDGFGAFGPRLDYATGTHPVFLAVADVDGDGAADLLVSNMDSYYGGALVTVLVNDGKGTFSAGGEVPSPLAESGGPMAVADLNGDGRDDVVVLSYAGDVVIVLLNDGDGSFEPGTVYDADSRPLGVVATDLNGDGRPDLAVLHETNVSGSGDFVGVFVNQGDGTFHARVDYAAAPFAGTMTAADMDGNGATDLVVTDWRSGTVSVLRNRCDATFAPRVPFDGGPFPTWAAAADLNGDGRPDLVVINSFDCLLTTLFGACD